MFLTQLANIFLNVIKIQNAELLNYHFTVHRHIQNVHFDSLTSGADVGSASLLGSVFDPKCVCVN